MAENIKRHITHIKSKVANQKPTSSQLLEGEVAVNYAKDKEFLSIKNESGDVVTFSSDNYYTEQKLGSGFTGSNSGNTVTKVIEDNEKVISSALNALNEEISNLDETYVTLDTNQTISGKKTFSETIKIEDGMNVSGTARFNGDAKIDGHLYANGTTDLYETQLHSTLQMGDNHISNVGTLTVNGTAHLIGGLDMSSNDIKNVQSITITGTTRTNGNLETHNIKPMTGDTYNIGTKSSDPTKNKYYRTIYVRNVNDIQVNNLAQSKDVNYLIYNLTNVSGAAGGTNLSASWSGNCSGITELTDGMNIQIKIPNGGHATGVTISINGGTKHKCILNASTNLTTHYPQGAIIRLVYDANQSGTFYTGSTTTVTTQGVWKIANYDSNSDTIGYSLGYNQVTFKVDAPTYRYVMLLTKDETTLTPVNSVDNVTAGTKTLTTEEFDPFGGIYYKNSKTNVTAGSTLAASTVWTQYVLDLRYSFNTTNTLIAQKAVYMVVVPQSNGKVKLHTNPISQTLPTTEDGLVYIYLGQAYSTTNLYLAAEHPLYQFKNGKLISYTADDNVDSELSDTSENPVQNKVITNALAFKKVTNPTATTNVGIVNTLSQYYNPNIGKGAVIEGDGSSNVRITASGDYSHAEGSGTIASGFISHAEGANTTASNSSSHAEGYNSNASGTYSHAEGSSTTASGACSHAEGGSTTASGSYSHTEGNYTIANNKAEHASGQYNVSSSASTTFGDSGNTLFSVGNGNDEDYRHNAFEIRQNGDIYITKNNSDIKLQDALGGGGVVVDSALSDTSENPVQNKVITNALAFKKIVNPSATTNVGIVNTLSQYYNTNIGKGAVIEGSGDEDYIIQAIGNNSHAEGFGTTASGMSSHAEGDNTIANGNHSHAEGSGTISHGYASHTEGQETTANGACSHAEGFNTIASGISSHAEGEETTANGRSSHAEGQETIASGHYSHAEGETTTASGPSSHAEGYETHANGDYSHAEGQYTATNNQSEHASGQYNVSSSASTTFGDSGNTLFSVGNGNDEDYPHNAFEIRQNGDIYIVKDNTDVKLQDELFSGNYNDLTNKPTIPVVPTNVSAFNNDSGYITIDAISGKADTTAVTQVNSALTAHTANTDVHVTSSEKTTWNNKSDFSGNYNDLTNKPTIPSYTAGSGITISNDTISAKIWSGTKADYETLTNKDSDTIYLIYNE